MCDAGRTPYGVLGVAEGASFSEVKRAYWRKARATHPDAPGGSVEAFREVQRAFETLRRLAPMEERFVRRSRSTPYDPWLTRPRAARQWIDDSPLLPTPRGSTRRPNFADILATELRRRRPD